MQPVPHDPADPEQYAGEPVDDGWGDEIPARVTEESVPAADRTVTDRPDEERGDHA